MWALLTCAVAQLNTTAGEMFGINGTCVTEHIYRSMHDLRTLDLDNKIYVDVFPYVLIMLSCICILLGGKLMKSCIAMLGLFSGFLCGVQCCYGVTSLYEELSCNAILAGCLLLAICAAFALSCLVKTAAFLIGSAAGAAVVYAIFDAVPQLDYPVWGASPIFMELRLFPFWTVCTVVALATGIQVRAKHTQLLTVMIAVLGAWGVTIGVKTALLRHDISLAAGYYVACFVALPVIGVAYQWRTAEQHRGRESQSCSRGAHT